MEWDEHEKLESLDVQLPRRAALGFPPREFSSAILDLAFKNYPGKNLQ